MSGPSYDLFLLGRQHYEHIHPFKLGSHFDDSCFGQIFLQALKQGETEFLVRNLTASEMNSCFDLVPIVKNSYRVVLFKLVIVFVSARPELDLLDGNKSLFGFGFLLFLFLLVLILAEVDDSANGRLSLRRNFDKIEAFTARNLERLLRWHHTYLPTVFIDDSDLANPYPFVDSHGRHAVPSVSESPPLIATDTVSS